MDADFNQKMKDCLLTLKKDLIESLLANNDDFRHIVEDAESKDSVDVASDDIDRKMLEVIGSKDINRLKLIDSALTRIEQKKYGCCMKCGSKIPQERLEAIPYALLCIGCKSADEKRNR
ncbi:MAG: TraR/DksA family transcriptional regulator [Treponemataceae bacterium]